MSDMEQETEFLNKLDKFMLDKLQESPNKLTFSQLKQQVYKLTENLQKLNDNGIYYSRQTIINSINKELDTIIDGME